MSDYLHFQSYDGLDYYTVGSGLATGLFYLLVAAENYHTNPEQIWMISRSLFQMSDKIGKAPTYHVTD